MTKFRIQQDNTKNLKTSFSSGKIKLQKYGRTNKQRELSNHSQANKTKLKFRKYKLKNSDDTLDASNAKSSTKSTNQRKAIADSIKSTSQKSNESSSKLDPREVSKSSKSRLQKIKESNVFQHKVKDSFKADIDSQKDNFASENLARMHNVNVDSVFYGKKLYKHFDSHRSKQKTENKESNKSKKHSEKSQKLKFNREDSEQKKAELTTKQKKERTKKRNKKIFQESQKAKEATKTTTRTQAIGNSIKEIAGRIGTAVTSASSSKTLLYVLLIALVVTILFSFMFMMFSMFAYSSESAYVFTAEEATKIDKTFTEKEVDYVIKLKKEINKADSNTIINFEQVGHEPHELLALINVMILPEAMENNGKVKWKSIESAIDEAFNARYQLEERKETYEVETESGRKIKKTRVYLTSNTESFDNIVSGVSGDIPANTQEFLELIGDDATEIAHKNGLYASVMLAQAILETGSGSSDLSSPPYYNLFGIKGSYEGETVYMSTQEDDGTGNKYTITDGFRDYPSYRESMEDYAYVMKNQPRPGFYAPTWKANTESYRDATAYLQGTYATDTQYASKLNNIIESFNLTKYDRPYLANASKEDESLEEVIDKEIRTTKDIKDGNILQFTDYEKELYKKQKEIRGLMGTYPSPLESGDWNPRLIEQHGFKWNRDRNKKEKVDGIKLKVDPGENIISQVPGKVSKADGSKVEIKSEDTMTFIYENLETIYVSKGDVVRQGDIVGTTSSEPLIIKTRNKRGREINPQIIMHTDSPRALMYNVQSLVSYSGSPGRLNHRMSAKEFENGEVQRLFDTAKKYMGMPYVFGGKTPQSSFDCSGLVVWVYTESGVRPMEYQTAQGIHDYYTVPISKEEAKPGDLVFFENTYNTNSRITHVGIYAGDNIMFHAGDPIGFARIDTAYWKSKSPQFGRVVE